MGVIVSFGVSPSFALGGTFEILDNYGADASESYLTDGISVFGGINIDPAWPISAWDINEIETNSAYNGLCCLFLQPDGQNCYACYGTNSGLSPNIFATFKGDTNTGDPWGSNTFPFSYWNPSMVADMAVTLTCNIPIFDSITYVAQYLQSNDPAFRGNLIKDHALNYKAGEEVPDGVDFEIKNAWTYGEWTAYGQPAVNYVNYRCLRGRIVSGRMCYYPIQGIVDGSLKYQIVSNATFYALEVSNDGTSWTPVESNTLPFDFFYRPRVNELGAFNYGLTFSNDSIPRFKDDEDADDYLDGDKNESDAENWDEISDNYPDPQITVGEPDEDPTEMGEVYTRSFFSQQYICDAGAMSEISNALFDTTAGGIWEDIKKGLEMYGDSPVDDIQGCMYFPFPLAQVLTSTQSQNYIYFGGYKFEMSNNVQKIIYPNGFINFGNFNCPYRFGGSFRDYAPYRRLTVYLPYIGWAELDLKRYIGKSVNVRYYIDTRTGGCLACLFADGILYDYFNGQMGVSMPITATDFVAYANAQINTLLGGAGAMKNNAGSLASGAQSMISQGVSAGSAIAGLAPVAGLAVGANVAKTMYGLTQNNINNFNVTKGASSSMLNCYLPQNVMFLDEVQKGKPTPNELSLMGYPSNASGNLQNFSGYLECDAVNLICDTATDNERAEIMALLRSGVYI